MINPQAGIKELAERYLRSNSHPALKNIACDYLDGVLVLRGSLPTYYLKQVAQEVLAQLDGVERIDNQIQVVTPGIRSYDARPDRRVKRSGREGQFNKGGYRSEKWILGLTDPECKDTKKSAD